MSYINIIKRSYPLVLIACDALTVEPSKIFPEHRFCGFNQPSRILSWPSLGISKP